MNPVQLKYMQLLDNFIETTFAGVFAVSFIIVNLYF